MDDIVKGTPLRLVVQRMVKNDDGQPDLFGTQYVYRAVVTKDFGMDPVEVIRFYNQRGAIERNFDMQNNDFGWADMPFSRLCENKVFLIMTAMVKNFYLYLVRKVSRCVKGLEPTSRIKKFVRKFVAVPARWIHTGRRLVLKLFTPYNFYDRLTLLL